jgi:molybdopterin/thiamine biosynthesis adenylyltransferase
LGRFRGDYMAKLTINAQEKRAEDWDGTFQMMSWWDSNRVKEAKVMVVGAGALGNEVLKNLALMNVGNIVIIDFDTIEFSNLCRSVLFRASDVGGGRLKADVAAARIQEINPAVKVKTIQGDIMIDVGLGVFRRMDVIIGCLDNRLARLFLNRLSYRVNKVWIDGAIENLSGQLNVYQQGKSCYECQLTDLEWSNIRTKLGCPDIARRNALQGKIPTTPISSSIIGAMQVQEAIKVIHGNLKQSMAGEIFKYEGMNNWILQVKAAELNEDCDSHHHIEKIIEAVTICLEHELVLEVTTMTTEITSEIIIPKPHLSDSTIEKFQVEPGENVAITGLVNRLDSSFPKPKLTLRQAGIPYLHIITVEANGELHFVELTKDEGFLGFS